MKKITRRQFIRQSAAFSAATFCVSPLVSTSAWASANKVRIHVGYLPITDHLIFPISHALEAGGYKGVEVIPHLCRSWDEIVGKMDMGVIQAAFLLSPLAMDTCYEKNMKCVLLGHRNGSVIAARKSIKTALELAGSVIGIPHAKSTHTLLLYKYMKDHGVENLHDLRLRKVPPPQTVTQVEFGEINGYSVAEPWGIRGVHQGVVSILEYSRNIIPDHACCILMVRKRLLAKYRSAVQEWVDSLLRAGDWVHQYPEKAAALQEVYMGHQPADVLKVLDQEMISYRSLRPDKGALQIIHDLAIEAGLLADPIDMDDFIDPRFA